MTVKVDAKKRVVLPSSRPGEIYDVQQHREGYYELIRLERPVRKKLVSLQQSLQAISATPLTQKMSWEQLKAITRGE